MKSVAKIDVLVTGANGQLGSELGRIAEKADGFDFTFTGTKDLDITSSTSIESLVAKIKPKFIVNAAAYTAVDKAEKEEERAFLVNAEAVKFLAESAKNVGAKLIHISTDYVFDGMGHEPYLETDLTSPQSVYGHSKLKGEEYALNSGVAMIIRTSWLYSAFGNNFVKTIVNKGKQGNLRVVSDQIGSPTWAYDLAEAIVHILKHSKDTFYPEVFHYSNEGVCSWYDFAQEIFRLSGIGSSIEAVSSQEYPTIAKRPSYSVLNKQKIKETFGLEIPYWRTSLEECLQIINKEI